MLGGICAAAAVLAFLGLHWILHYAGQVTANLVPLMPTTKIMRPLAGAAIPIGLVIGLGAGVLRRHRVGALVAAGMAGYVLTSVIATVWLKPRGLGEHGLMYWLAQGLWASLTYAVVAGPPLVVALVALERLTRPPDTPADAEAHGEDEPLGQDDEAAQEPEEPSPAGAAKESLLEPDAPAAEAGEPTAEVADDEPATDGDEADDQAEQQAMPEDESVGGR